MLTKEQIGEIRTAYRDAKDQKKQIGILADLYACDKAEIRQVLGIEDAPPQAPPADQPDQPKSVTHHRTPGLDPGVILRELQTGVEGLQAFVDNFAGVDIFDDDQWAMLDIILAKAEGFAAGMDTALQLRRYNG